MLEITSSGEVYYIQDTLEKTFFGVLEPERPSGLRRLSNPTGEFWQMWRTDKHVLQRQIGFRVRKERGRWVVDIGGFRLKGLSVATQNAVSTQDTRQDAIPF